MIWPWSEIKQLRDAIYAYERTYADTRWREQLWKAEYYKLLEANRGAHKGIWRLKQKLKKASAATIHLSQGANHEKTH